jgi:hypothetical protein
MYHYEKQGDIPPLILLRTCACAMLLLDESVVRQHVCPTSLVWLELLELMKGRSGVALTQLSISSSIVMLVWSFVAQE